MKGFINNDMVYGERGVLDTNLVPDTNLHKTEPLSDGLIERTTKIVGQTVELRERRGRDLPSGISPESMGL